jgi:hypothetical protein
LDKEKNRTLRIEGKKNEEETSAQLENIPHLGTESAAN